MNAWKKKGVYPFKQITNLLYLKFTTILDVNT